MISLFIDTSSYNLIIGIYKDLKEIYLSIEKNDNNLSERILVNIDQAFKEVNLNIKQIDNIFVVNGPGSFTGTRIGVTVAKTLAWGLKKPVYRISELEVLASKTEEDYIVPMIDARRGYVYAGMYDNKINQIVEDCYISLDDLYNKVKRHAKISNVAFVSYDKIDHNKIIDIESPIIDIEKIISKHINDKNINPHILNPIYLKSTEAEEKLGKNV